MFKSDPIYYANYLFVNNLRIYSIWYRTSGFIQFNIVRAAWFQADRLLVINHYEGWDWLPGIGQTAASL